MHEIVHLKKLWSLVYICKWQIVVPHLKDQFPMDPVQFLEVQNYDLIFLPMGKIILKLLNKIPVAKLLTTQYL